MQKEYNYHTKIMGCDFDMTFITTSVEKADNYFIQALNIAKFYEEKFSRFNNDSELSLLNKRKTLEVSDLFMTIYEIAFDLYKRTGKKFNPLAQVSYLGYDKSFEKIKDNINDYQEHIAKYNIDLGSVVVSSNKIILQRFQKLDFAGFLKGYVAQEIALKINNPLGTIINIGGDIYVQNFNINNKKFTIEIVHPNSNSKNVFISIANESVCTSGIYKRKWVNSENKIKHHIVDVSSKDSAQSNILSATIIHKNGAIADAYATVAIILGLEKSLEFLNKQTIDFILIEKNNKIHISRKLKQKICK